jgi:hypothetical protein
MAKHVPKISVVLSLPPLTLPLIARMNEIVGAMSTNVAIFKSPPLALSVVQGHVADLVTAQTAADSHAKGTAAARDAKRKLVVADAMQLHAYVQQLANASPEQAESIAHAAAMRLRSPKASHKSDLAVKHVVSGSVRVLAKGLKGARAHEWQYSADGGKTWTAVPSSLAGHTTITGLQPATTVSFRHRYITKAGAGDWSQPVTAVVS